MSILPVIIIFWGAIIGITASKTGHPVVLWIVVTCFLIPVVVFGGFLLFSNFYPCNSEGCEPLSYGTIIGSIAPILIFLFLISKRIKTKERMKVIK